MDLSAFALTKQSHPGTTRDKTICPICNSLRTKKKYAYKDFGVLVCMECGTSWRSNMYDEQQIDELYGSEEYFLNPYFEYDDIEISSRARPRFKNYDRALALAEHFFPVNGVMKFDLLDVGCGSGSFMMLAKERGWNVFGLELSLVLAKQCEERVHAPVVKGSFERLSLSEKYNVVTMWDFIEHVIDPVETLRKAKNLLKHSGLLLICTPDENSLLARLGKVLYTLGYAYPSWALHPQAHTYFFSRRVLRNLLGVCGFEVVEEYSQEAFFEHSGFASPIQKTAIRYIERVGRMFDRAYEDVVLARNKDAA